VRRSLGSSGIFFLLQTPPLLTLLPPLGLLSLSLLCLLPSILTAEATTRTVIHISILTVVLTVSLTLVLRMHAMFVRCFLRLSATSTFIRIVGTTSSKSCTQYTDRRRGVADEP
jgi:hypothetical protein